jgi:Holliday junction resolvasome RuvABC endonuclease subunit
MMAAATRKGLTMAVHPNTRGFGWVVFEGPFAPLDWGLVFTARDKNARCLAKLEKMLARFLPDTIILEEFERQMSARTERIKRLCRAMVSLAADRGVEVAIYAKGEVQACFASVGARTRREIAEAVARHIDAFRHRLPNKRQPWENEDRRMSIFAAAALVLTHFQLGTSRLLDGLGGAA